MMRSLYSGISGIKSLQSNMDVIGNNISNVSTVGYKAGRMTFQDALSQTLGGATRPGGRGAGSGGTNPLQVGLGTGVASVDSNFGQGNLQKTGLTTDLAIQGSAFFVVGNGDDLFYTRNGSFTLDAEGHLVMPKSGMILQGFNADDNGDIPVTATQDDILIPYNTQAPARATEQIDFARNLNADSMAKGTISHSARFLSRADGTVPLTSLTDKSGNNLMIQEGDNLVLSARDPSSPTATVTSTFQVGTGTNLQTLRGAIENFLSTTANSPGTQVTINPTTSQLEITPGSGPVSQFRISSARPTSDSRVANAFSFPSNMAAAPATPYRTNTLLRPAVDTDLVRNIYDQNGKALGSDPVTLAPAGLENGDNIKISGAVGGIPRPAIDVPYNANTTTMGDLLTAVQNQLGLPATDGTALSNPTVSLNAAGSTNNMPEGAIVIRGLPGADFSISDVSIRAADTNNLSPSPSSFNSNMGMNEFQEARSAGEVSTSITTYDQKGFPHNVAVTFTKSVTPDEWYWQAAVAGTEVIQGGGSGRINFGTDGTVSNFSFDDSSGVLSIDPRNGSDLMQIALNPGGPGRFSGLTQFNAANTASAVSQDGHTMGALRNISIGSDGVIIGQFSNGVTRSLAQVVVADFTNPQGLSHESESVYAQSANSGDPVFGRPGGQSTSTIESGTLEMSNVDLASQFTDMITTQRGYQANARIITTSDSMMQELVGLVR
ncbi:MAG TPA: flagellar hook-basal body complex protein [Fibrobacteria bacterium]|nr:flagellar hook-basal body complex protein [Fibrobacteria bacterium]HOX50246.1 flagellar hook-basal body complex protein [Fibrobacteria bacterium]